MNPSPYGKSLPLYRKVYGNSHFRTLKPKISKMCGLILQQVSYSTFIKASLLQNNRNIFKNKKSCLWMSFVSFRWRAEVTADVWIWQDHYSWRRFSITEKDHIWYQSVLAPLIYHFFKCFKYITCYVIFTNSWYMIYFSPIYLISLHSLAVYYVRSDTFFIPY